MGSALSRKILRTTPPPAARPRVPLHTHLCKRRLCAPWRLLRELQRRLRSWSSYSRARSGSGACSVTRTFLLVRPGQMGTGWSLLLRFSKEREPHLELPEALHICRYQLRMSCSFVFLHEPESFLVHVFRGGGSKYNPVCRGQKAIYGNRFSPSIIWVPVIKLRLAGWAQAPLPDEPS